MHFLLQGMVLSIALTLVGCNSSTQFADTLYINAKVYTVDQEKRWVEAFAVKGNQFVGVGSEEELQQYRGGSTKVVDLDGKMVLPGFVEDHIHPDMGAENMMGVLIKASEMSWPEQADVIRSFAEKDKGKGWIVGGALNWLADNGEDILETGVPSHYSTLDKLVSERPVMLWDIGGHAVLLNSRAMQELDITAASENPEGGVVVKDAHGQPTGVLRETAANFAYEVALKELPRGRELIEQGIKPVFASLNERGFTSISDVWARFYMLDAYREMADNNELSLRIRTYIADPIEWLSQEWKQGARQAIANHQEYYRENWLDASGVKFVLDGSAGGQTIIMVEPYEGTKDVHGGPWRNDPEYFREKFMEYDAMGLTIKSHGVGTQTIRTILDAIEESRERGSELRHSVAHATLIHPDDIPRFKPLDVVAEFSPYFWYPVAGWDIIREELGQHRLDWAFPFKTLSDQGVHISVGSDWPVAEDPNPFPEIESMITRQKPGGNSNVLASHEERISLETAIHAFTMGGAYAQNREDIIGSIEAGKFADFIVVDRNLFETELYDIHKTKVLQTVVDGKTVYSR